MKDATGELSMTAVAVVAIAAIGVVFSTLIWPQIRTNIMRSTYCSQAFDCGAPNDRGMQECSYCPQTDESVVCDDPQPISCPGNRNTH
jgi:hypothetical protein